MNKSILIGAVFVLVLTACGGEPIRSRSSPTNVATAYVDVIQGANNEYLVVDQEPILITQDQNPVRKANNQITWKLRTVGARFPKATGVDFDPPQPPPGHWCYLDTSDASDRTFVCKYLWINIPPNKPKYSYTIIVVSPSGKVIRSDPTVMND